MDYKVDESKTLKHYGYWDVLTEQEKTDYQNHIKKIETDYYDEFDTCRERLDMLVIALNDFYSTIAETRLQDQKLEELKRKENEQKSGAVNP